LSLSFVLLAACHKRELAGESRTGPKGITIGIFTNAIIDALSELRSYNLSYATLTERSTRAVAARTNTQTPECVGNGNRILFKLDVTEGDVPFELAKAIDGLYIIFKAGEAQGISRGTTFNVRTRGQDSVLLGTLEVVGPAYDMDSSYAKPSFDPDLDPENLWAFLHKLSYSEAPLKVCLGSAGLFYPEQTGTVKVTDINAADVVLSKDGYSWVLERKEPRIVRECSSHITLPVHVQSSHLNNVLAGIAHFNYHLTRTNPFHSNEAVTIEMYQVTKQSNNIFCPKDGNDLVRGEVAELVFDSYAEANYGFTLKNKSATDWYPYLFHFDPDDYSIYVSAPPLIDIN
jgi:hypothetical protein